MAGITNFYMPTRIVAGSGSLATIGTLARELKMSRVLVVSDPIVSLQNFHADALAALAAAGLKIERFDECGIDARCSHIDDQGGWIHRIAAIGHGQRTELSGEEALDIAQKAQPDPAHGVEADDPSGLKGGELVNVSTDEAGDPIRGILVAANAREIVIRSENQRVGIVHVHFPRFGYSVVAERAA